MRVLIAGLWAATEPSGICRTVANLVRGLNEADATIEVVLAIGTWQREYFAKAFGLHSAKVRMVEVEVRNSTIGRNGWYLFGLPRLARAYAADVVHLGFPAPVLRNAFEAVLVTTVHDLYPYECPENFGFPRVFGNRFALRRSVAASDRVACVSEKTRLSLMIKFPRTTREKTVCIENAVSVAPRAENSRSSISKPFLLAVAQHRANKRLPQLLRAFHCYLSRSDSAPSLQLLIVGAEGPETPKLRELKRELALEDRVELRSSIADAELAELYRSCELFITLSALEGYGLPLGEAMAAGARVLASDIPAHRAVGRDRCLYVRAEGGEERARIAEAIGAALSAPRPVSSDRLPSPVGAARQYLALYKDALSSRPVPMLGVASHSSSSWELR